MEGAGGEIAHGLVDGALVQFGEGLRGKLGISGIGGQGGVEIGGAFTQEPGRFQVGTDQFLGQGGHFRHGQIHQRFLGHEFGPEVRLGGQGRLKEVAQGVQGVFPGIALIGHKAVEDAQGDGLPMGGAVLQSSGHRGAVDERGLFGEKETYFQVQIHPFFRPAHELQDEPVAEDDGGIALLGLHDGGRERGLHQALDIAKYIGGFGDQLSILAFEAAAMGEARKKGLMQAVFLHRLIKQALLARTPEAGHHGLGKFLLHLGSSFPKGYGQGQDIGFRLPFHVRHSDQGKVDHRRTDPPEQRMRVALLGFDVDDFKVILRIEVMTGR